MRLLWLCNMVPGKIKEKLSAEAASGGLWVDHVLSGLRRQGLTIHVLCPGDGARGALDERCSYTTFREGLPYVYLPELERDFEAELKKFRPDVIHIWGTEYGHTLAMVNAAETLGLLGQTVISIQGLCSVYAGHYAEGVPYRVQREFTFRDAVRQDNILQQQTKFARRGELEIAALKKVRHVIGRTDWDEACTGRISPGARYHFCNETLREPFYAGQWQYAGCRKHRIFASSCVYPVKGFHYLLEAFAEVTKDYPGATLAVPGKSFLTADKLRRTSYQKYLAALARKYGVADKIEFLGSLSAAQMKEAFLEANVFVLPSTIENSPNSLGEAMLLGVPCVASDVGGVANLMTHNREGYLYQSSAPYMLAYYLKRVFAMGDGAKALGASAKAHAAVTHDPEKNLRELIAIYHDLA
ncbi:MAG: glycosyltransferase family 4 protein [Eubacteriales bacterium]|nr:glycosyltransferase family 4 protein [Eubacteriales bacterium]